VPLVKMPVSALRDPRPNLQSMKDEGGRMKLPTSGRFILHPSSFILRALLFALCPLLFLLSRPAAATPDLAPPDAPAPPNVSASCAILVDAVTGTVLWERNANQRRAMASTTKIMTATVLLERARMTDAVTFSEHAVRTPYANLNARPGEQLGMLDLLYAIMLRSANDGCVAAAEHVAGSEAAFVGLMNDKARQLGALDTHFVTTNGLYDAQHYSTAADLSRITRYAIRYPLFNEVVRTPLYRLTSRTVNRNDTLLENHNRFLGHFGGADGVKTGYIRQSGKCLVASASRLEGNYPWRLLCVVLNSKDIYADSAALLEYGFVNYQPVFFARQGQPLGSAGIDGGRLRRVPLVAGSDAFAVVRRGTPAETKIRLALRRDAQAPVKQDQVLGTLHGFLNGQEVMSVDALAGRAVAASWTAGLTRWGAPWLLGMLLLGLGPRYARAVAEGARRRRRRLPPRLRSAHLQWASEREWGGRTGTWESG
jgi:D-alanyl-D-alanine carboxypeptidase (penicillin-binding protein 5/6)